MATLTSFRLLCMLSFSISVSSSATNSSLPEPHLPHIPHDPGSPDNYSLSSRIIVSALGILLFIVFIIILLHIYAKWCWWRRASIQQRMLAELHGTSSLPLAPPHDSAKPCGLDKAILTALPTFEYKPQMLRTTPGSLRPAAIAKAAECTVCLAEFRQGEACKLLPKCEHFFHTRCIDVWFLSNATCPLCRAIPGELTVDDEEAAHPRGGEADEEQCQETQRGPWCKQNTGVQDEEKGAQDDEAPLNAGNPLQSQKWRRSFSDKVLGEENRDAGYRAQLPARPALVWERSASYSTIDSLRDSESLVELSRCSRVSSLVSARGACHDHRPPPLGEPKSLVRVFSK